MNILVLNAGSSSLKYKLFDMGSSRALARGLIERIGQPDAGIKHLWDIQSEQPSQTAQTQAVPDQSEALQQIVRHLAEQGLVRDESDIAAVGHRVVHGGERFSEPALIDDDVVEGIRAVIPLAPLHNPANLEGIQVARQRWPELPQVAVFDTAFHHTMPPHAYRYALPTQLYREHGVRRYGFHGSSHRFVSKEAARFLGREADEVNLISLHLGNGCSATAIRNGASVDTSMGMTPLEGLVMGTRSGDIDPSIPFFLGREASMSPEQIETLLNKQSGLKGVCDISDMREIHAAGEAGREDAKLAEEMFAYRVKKYVGAYMAVLGRVDAVLFTGGIGEQSARIRQLVCEGLEPLGMELDPQANAVRGEGCRAISRASSRTPILVVPTDEELEIAESVAELIAR